MVVADFRPAIEFLLNQSERFHDRAYRGMAQAGADVVEMFRTEQLSGRKPDNTGLEIRTGNLFNSLTSDVEDLGHTLVSTISNHDAKYWYYHQEGLGHNPKRLTLEERFQDKGLDIYRTHLEGALAEVFQ